MSNSKSAIDLKDVLERVQDDTELLVELLDIFLEDYKEKHKLLEELITHKDFEQIRNVAHSLKGAAGNISATDFHRSFSAMEQFGDESNLDGINKMMLKLEEDFPKLQRSIEEIKAKYNTG